MLMILFWKLDYCSISCMSRNTEELSFIHFNEVGTEKFSTQLRDPKINSDVWPFAQILGSGLGWENFSTLSLIYIFLIYCIYYMNLKLCLFFCSYNKMYALKITWAIHMNFLIGNRISSGIDFLKLLLCSC